MIRAYHQPQKLDEALALLANGAVPVGGATALFTARTARDVDLVDVTRLGLDEVRIEPACVKIGASVVLSRIATAREIPGMPGALLRKACRALASLPLRNMITVGGNIANVNYWADLPPVLLALDAKMEVQRAGKAPELLSAAQLFALGRQAWDGGLITRIDVPLTDAVQGFGYERFARTVNDYSLATLVVTARKDGDLCRDVRVVFGAIQPRPSRDEALEQALEGKAPTKELTDQALAGLLERVNVAPNFRASSEYRKKLVVALARRAINTACSWAAREA